jgi:NAD-dependent deacetylase
MKRKLVILSGAGMSAESGIPTFRGSDGLWEGHRIEDVATPGAWHRNRALVLDFYNQRRKGVINALPNEGHLALARAEEEWDVWIITQNVDDLHERAGSGRVLHLHGEIRKARSTADANHVVDIEGWELKEGDRCPKGSQLRPHIVWFGEEVPELGHAAEIASDANVFAVIGTSLQVYPAAGLVDVVPKEIPKFLIDPGSVELPWVPNLTVIRKGAAEGVPEMLRELGDV